MLRKRLGIAFIILIIGLTHCASDENVILSEEGMTVFTFDVSELKGVENVQITGDFTEWFPEVMALHSGNLYYKSYALDPGSYRFSILINGEISPDMSGYEGWFTPQAEAYESDGVGGVSAVITISE